MSRSSESAIQLDRLDNFAEIIRNCNRPICKAGSLDIAAAEHFIELVLVGGVIGDGRRRIFQQLMPCQMQTTRASAPITMPAVGAALRRPTLAALAGSQPITAGPDLSFRVHDLLVRDFADDAVAEVLGPQALVQIDRSVDLDRARDGVEAFLPA